MSVKMLSEYENGKRDMPIPILFKIADVLMVSVDELVPARLKKQKKTSPEEDALIAVFRKLNTYDKSAIIKSEGKFRSIVTAIALLRIWQSRTGHKLFVTTKSQPR